MIMLKSFILISSFVLINAGTQKTDRLVEISPKNWQNLLKLYKPNREAGYSAYYVINNYIRWFDKDPSLEHVKFYCLNVNFSDGTFVMNDRYHAYADTLNKSHDNLSRMLQLLDYTKGFIFLSESNEMRPTIVEAIEKANAELKSVDTFMLCYLPMEEAIKLDPNPPAEIELCQLNLNSDVEKANAVFPQSHAGCKTWMKRLITYNPSVGAYTKDGTLVSWLFRLSSGFLGALQTNENYLKNGYGSIVAKYLSKKVSQRNSFGPMTNKS